MTIAGEIALALLLVAVALAHDTSIDTGYGLPKLVALQLLAPLVLAFAAYRLWYGSPPDPPVAPVAAALALGSWWAIVTVTAAHPHTCLHGMHGSYNGLTTQITCLGLFVAAALAPDLSAVHRRLRFVVVALVPVAAYALYQYFAPDPRWPSTRPPSTIGQPVLLAALLSLALPFTLASTLDGRSRGRQIVSGVATAVLAAAIATSLSRGPLVGAIVAALIVLVALARVSRVRLLPFAIGLTLLLGGATVTLLNPQRIEGIALRLRAFTQPGADPSIAGRLVFYRAAWRMVADHPLTGVGLESFGLLYPRYRPVEPPSIPIDNIPTMVHNGYLHWATTAGLPGLLLYLLALGTVAWGLFRAYRRDSEPQHRVLLAAFLASLAGYAIQDLSGWLEPSLSVFFWTILGLAVASSREDLATGVSSSRSFSRIAAAVVVIAALGSSALSIPRTLAELRAARTLGDIASASAPALQSVVSSLPGDAYYLDRVGREWIERFHARPERRSYLDTAALLDRAAGLNPFDPYIPIHRIELEALAEAGPPSLRPLLGAEHAVAAVTATDPNNSTVHLAIATLRYRQKRLTEARQEVEEALRLRPGRGAALVLRGDIEHEAGNPRAAAEAYAAAATQLDAASGEWLDAQLKRVVNLLADGQTERAAVASEALTNARPESSKAHLLLGVACGMRGDLRRARAAYGQALRLDPGNVDARSAMASLSARPSP